jgi:hypothetical protein
MLREKSFENATLDVIIRPVNHPPYPNSTEVIIYANKLYQFKLTGHDDDGNITGAWIVEPPNVGSLFTTDVLMSRLGNLSTPCNVYNATTVCGHRIAAYPAVIGYQLSDSHLTGAPPYHDNFTFIVEDNHHQKSIIGYFSISVVTSVVAIPNTPYGPNFDVKPEESINQEEISFIEPLVTEDQMSVIYVYGIDYSDHPRNITCTIVTLPTKGTLYYKTKNSLSNNFSYELVKPNQTVSQFLSSKSYSKGFQFYYKSDSNDFTFPIMAWNGSLLPSSYREPDHFTFLIRTVQSLSSQTISSQPTTQFITIQNLNDPTEVIALNINQQYTIYAVNDHHNKYPYQLTFDTFEVFDPDLNVDLIVVHIQALYGILTITNRERLHLDFSSVDYCYKLLTWQCIGSGYEDSEMRFVASPTEVQLALNSLMYQSLKPYVHDVVNITLYDGEGESLFPPPFPHYATSKVHTTTV